MSSTGNAPFQWVVGGFYSHIKRQYNQTLSTPGYDAVVDTALGAGTSAAAANGFGADAPYQSNLPKDLEQFAGFGEASYKLGQFKLTGGGRYYNYKEKSGFITGGLFAGNQTQFATTKSSGFTPRAILSFEPSNRVTVNAVVAQGFRLGGVNEPLTLSICTPADAAIFGGRQRYKDETMWSYELNMKTRGHGFTFNAGVFYNDLKNLQTTVDAGSCSSRVVFNVPKAHSQGVEFELTTSPTSFLDFGVSGSVVSSKFGSTVLDGTGAVVGGIQKGNRLASVPKFQLSADANLHHELSATATGNLRVAFQHVGSRFTQPGDQVTDPQTFVSGLPYHGATGTEATVLSLKLPAYQLVNLSAGVDLPGGVNITAYVSNVFDTNALLSFDRERGGRARLGFAVGQPRTFGITGRKTF